MWGINALSSTGQLSPCVISGGGAIIPRMSGVDRERVRELVTADGRSPRAISLAMGDNAYTVRDIISGRSKNPRADTLGKLAEQLGVSPAELIIDALPGEIRRVTPDFLPIRYEVGAGLWQESWPDEAFLGVSPVVPDPAYAGFPQWLERVVGDSMDREYRPGEMVHVVDAISYGYAPRHGDHVVLVRRKVDGREMERTVKEVARVGRHFEFWPRSTNPRWTEPVRLVGGLSDTEGVEVEIAALVIGSYRPRRT